MAAKPCEICSSSEFRLLFLKDDHRFERCRRCGHERVNPQPSDETLARIYGGNYYDAWGMHRDSDAVASLKRATFRRRILSLPPPKPGARILDCGAATGLLMGVASELGYEPYGVELNETGADQIASAFGAGHVHRGDFIEATFDGVEQQGFSVIFMYDFIEHVRDPEAVLRRAWDLLVPGGVLSICTPRAGSFTHRTMGRAWQHYLVEHLFYFRLAGLCDLLRRVGFRRIERRAALKTMSLDYFYHQFDAHPNRLVTPIFRLMHRALPTSLQRLHFRVLLGEMLLNAHRAE